MRVACFCPFFVTDFLPFHLFCAPAGWGLAKSSRDEGDSLVRSCPLWPDTAPPAVTTPSPGVLPVSGEPESFLVHVLSSRSPPQPHAQLPDLRCNHLATPCAPKPARPPTPPPTPRLPLRTLPKPAGYISQRPKLASPWASILSGRLFKWISFCPTPCTRRCPTFTDCHRGLLPWRPR